MPLREARGLHGHADGDAFLQRLGAGEVRDGEVARQAVVGGDFGGTDKGSAPFPKAEPRRRAASNGLRPYY